MRSNIRKSAWVVIFTGLLAAVPMLVFGDTKTPGTANLDSHIVRQMRHQLVMLPYYGVFDNLEYKVSGNHVELQGQVVDPVLKDQAGYVAKRIKGVKSVTNKIQVLPLSNLDWRIRFAEYRAIFGHPGLARYSMGVNPAIHIIVDNGNVTLVGMVNSQVDKEIAGIEANLVPGVFSVTNNLRVVS